MIVFILANCADPDEMASLFAKVPVYQYLEWKRVNPLLNRYFKN